MKLESTLITTTSYYIFFIWQAIVRGCSVSTEEPFFYSKAAASARVFILFFIVSSHAINMFITKGFYSSFDARVVFITKDHLLIYKKLIHLKIHLSNLNLHNQTN